MREPLETTPHWEHGFRCHGFWVGTTQVGRVSIGPRRLWTPKDGYGCLLWLLFDRTGGVKEWKEATLAAAKRAVERAYRRHYPPPADAKVCVLCGHKAHDVQPVRPRERFGNALRGDGDTGFSERYEPWCDRCRTKNLGAYAR